MEPIHKELLRKHRLLLADELLVGDSIVPFLYQEQILTVTQVETIDSQPTNKHKTLKLLDILPTRGPRAFDSLLRSLEEDFSWVRDKLLLELQTRHEPETEPGLESDSTDFSLPDDFLLKVPSDRELSRLASHLGTEWETVLLDLGLSAAAVSRCRADNSLSIHGAALTGLVQWRRSEGKNATVQRLLQSLQAADFHPSILQNVLL